MYPLDFFDGALAFQSSSLEEFVYVAGGVNWLAPRPDDAATQGFRNFSKLHTVAIEGAHCPALEDALWGDARKDPPPLRVLRILGRHNNISRLFEDDDGEEFWDWLKRLPELLPDLRELHLVSHRRHLRRWSATRRRKMHALEPELKSKAFVFRLYLSLIHI